MPKYLLAYHGGAMPESEEQVAKVMAAWESWYGELGAAIVDGGNPTSVAKTVTAEGVTDGGGANPVTGYTLLNADSLELAAKLAQGCPILDSGGTVEVAETIDM